MRALKPIFYFLCYVAIALGLLIWRTDGHFTYGLDDAYIHLALAKHFVQDGVWGVTPYGPSACSSSILWPLLLSGLVYVFGPQPLIPFLLCLAIATGFLWWLCRSLVSQLEDPDLRNRLVLWIAFGSCLATLIFVGMEHVLQVWVCLWFAWHGAQVLSDATPTWRRAWPLIVLAALVSSTRYEGLALVAPVCVMLTLRHGYRKMFGKGLLIGIAVCASALAPVLLFGIAMHQLDLPFLPYSVQLKAWFSIFGVDGIWLHLGPKFIVNALCHPELVFLLAGCLYTLRSQLRAGYGFWRVPAVLQAVYVTACLLHLEFASTGPYARYVAYLAALGICALGVEAGPLFQVGFRRRAKAADGGRVPRLVAGGAVTCIVLWSVICHVAVPQMGRNIYQQQIQMARFLGTYYNGEAVALNDIGTSSFFTEIRMVDIFGLASKKVAEARLSGDYNKDEIDRITQDRNVQVAILYERWFQAGDVSELPEHWEKVGEWTIPLNITCGWHTVAIFAVDPDARDGLVANLRAFSGKLPKAVEQRGAYVNASSSVPGP